MSTTNKELGLIAADLRKGDKSGVVARTAALMARVATDVPLVGPLTEQSSRALAEFSGYGKMKAALAQVDTEFAEADRAAAVANAVRDVLREHLHGLEAGQQAIAAALFRLDGWLEEVHAELFAGRDTVHQTLVSGGRGVVLEAGQRNAVDITQGEVKGARTIGVHIKAKG